MPDPVDIRVGKKIRAVRRVRQISQTELGRRVGVSFQQIQKYEKGINRVSISRLWHISEAMDVDIATLIYSDPKAKQASDATENLGDRDMCIEREVNAIPNSRIKKRMVDLIRAISQQ